MKRPTWATVVGVLGIIFGGFGILGAGQDMLMPYMFTIQKEIFAGIEEQVEREADKQRGEADSVGDHDQELEKRRGIPFDGPPDPMFKMMEQMWNFPDWFPAWSVASGIFRLLLNGFYIMASIMLLMVKPYSIRIFYIAAGTSIGFSIIKAGVLASALSFMGIAMMLGGIFGIIIDIVLIVVVAISDKTAFRSPATEAI
jgi:hypothetical protein